MMRLGLTLVSIALLASCNKDESEGPDPSTPVYQQYKMEVRLDDNEIFAAAAIREDSEAGEPIELSSDFSVLINNQRWQTYNNLSTYFYGSTFSGINDVAFGLIKSTGASFENVLALADTHHFEFDPAVTELSKSESSPITWIGSPLQLDEQLEYFVDQNGTQTAIATVQGFGGNTLNTDPSMFSELSVGSARLYLTRSRTIEGLDEEDGTAGGKQIIDLERYISIQIVP